MTPFNSLILSSLLFCIGILGVIINRKSVIVVLIAIEIILLAANLNFIAFANYFNDINGQVCALFAMTIAAAEAAIGLAIIVIYYRNHGSIILEEVNKVRG